jgi:hypothetical protein
MPVNASTVVCRCLEWVGNLSGCGHACLVGSICLSGAEQSWLIGCLEWFGWLMLGVEAFIGVSPMIGHMAVC